MALYVERGNKREDNRYCRRDFHRLRKVGGSRRSLNPWKIERRGHSARGHDRGGVPQRRMASSDPEDSELNAEEGICSQRAVSAAIRTSGSNCTMDSDHQHQRLSPRTSPMTKIRKEKEKKVRKNSERTTMALMLTRSTAST